MNRWPTFFLLCGLLPALASAAEPVTVKPWSEVAVYLDRQAAARVESLNEAVLASEINARVLEIPVRPGQTVKRGESLLRLDDESYVIQLESATARLEMADAALDMARLRAERARRLVPERFVSEDELLEAETRLRQARAERSVAEYELATAELMLARTEIRAPFAGVVSRRLIGLGSLAAPGTPMLELIALDELEVIAGIPPEQVAGLERADSIAFVGGDQTRGDQGRPVEIARVAPVIDRATRNREARLVFVDSPAPPGSEGRIRWADPRPALPANYIVQREGELGVLVLEDDGQTVGFVPLPQADAGRPAAVDLAPETLLIDDGRRRVQPGDRVQAR
jgi:RND family efflux transporter MFP subunit